MAHFAKLDENNVVIEVNVVNNDDIQNLDFPESEEIGVAFLAEWSGGYTNWKQTSYNANFRKNYASVGGTYDKEKDAFISPRLYPSWVLDEENCDWVAPDPMPEVPVDEVGQPTGIYVWSEDEYNAGNGGWVFLAFEGE